MTLADAAMSERDASTVRAAELVATGCTRVRRGFLQYELEHKRIGANVWERVWVEAGRGELTVWKGVDAVQAGVSPTTEPMRKLNLIGARVELTKTPRKEAEHSFRITLSMVAVAGGGAAGDVKHVLATENADALAEWMATLKANVNLCELPPEEQQALIAQDERAAEAEELQAQLSGIALLCIGMCAKICTLGRACCASCTTQDGDKSYRPVTPTRAGGAAGDGEGDEWEEVAGGGAEATTGSPSPVVYICRKKQSMRETADKSSPIVGWVEEGARVDVFEERPGAAGKGHRRLRLSGGWVDSGSGAIQEDGKAMFVYFEPEGRGLFSAYRGKA